MKKLGKLTINPDKIIKNEELVNLRGGYDGYGGCFCLNTSGNPIGPSILLVDCPVSCGQACTELYGDDPEFGEEWTCGSF